MRRGATAGLLSFLIPVLAALAQGLGRGDRPPGSGRPAAARLADAPRIRNSLGLDPEYMGMAGVEAIKVAVLDYGFEGVGEGRPYLPEGAELVEHYDPDFVRRFGLGDPTYRKSFEPANRHGRGMAQIVWGVTGARPDGPKFYLLNANGPTMLRRAVRFAIERKVDVILFSGSFEGGGNGDGEGPINRIVDEAISEGILWINAAGNYGHRVYNGPVRILADGYLRLRDRPDVAALRFRNRLDENTVTVTLTWNDYRDAEDAGTDKNLDLDVEDWTGRRIGSSEKVQVSRAGDLGPEESRNPRERVVLTDLAASPEVPSDPDYGYRIRVRAKRGRFTSRDRIRILVTAGRDRYIPPGEFEARPAVEFLDATGSGEIYPPADNPLILTVGEPGPDSSVGPTADGRAKPDVVLEDSRAYFTDGQVSAGSSNAAAYLAGVVAVLKAAEPGLRPAHLLALARRGQTVVRPRRPASATSSVAAGTKDVRVEFRLWKTPTRVELAEILRGGLAPPPRP